MFIQAAITLPWVELRLLRCKRVLRTVSNTERTGTVWRVLDSCIFNSRHSVYVFLFSARPVELCNHGPRIKEGGQGTHCVPPPSNRLRRRNCTYFHLTN